MDYLKEVKKPVKRRPNINSLPESSRWKGKRTTFVTLLMALLKLIQREGHPETVDSTLQALEKPLLWLEIVPNWKAETFLSVWKRAFASTGKQYLQPNTQQTMNQKSPPKSPSLFKAWKSLLERIKTTSVTLWWSWSSHFARESKSYSNLTTKRWLKRK